MVDIVEKDYKQWATRIKRVKDGKGERFYAQYKQEIIPYIWWEWQNIRPSLGDDFHTTTLDEAKRRIDSFLERSRANWEGYLRMKYRPKVKKEVEYIKYP